MVDLFGSKQQPNGNRHDPFMIHKTEGLALIKSDEFEDLPRVEQEIMGAEIG